MNNTSLLSKRKRIFAMIDLRLRIFLIWNFDFIFMLFPLDFYFQISYVYIRFVKIFEIKFINLHQELIILFQSYEIEGHLPCPYQYTKPVI